jgi:cobalt-zinc-cadmium efflux system protein
MSHTHAHSPATDNKKKLALVFGLTFLYLIAEVIGGILTNSLALLADAGHMLCLMMVQSMMKYWRLCANV